MNQTPVPAGMNEPHDDEIDLGSMFETLWRYRRVFVVICLGILLAFGIVLVLNQFYPGSRSAATQFQLKFVNAEQGKYPNGELFDPADLMIKPILETGYSQNNLKNWLSFPDFKNALSIGRIESIKYLSQIEDLKQQLAARNITMVDRERIDAQIQFIYANMKSTEFVLKLKMDNGIPQEVAFDVLNDILQAWAEDVTLRRNVFKYLIPVPSQDFVDRSFIDSLDYIVGLDVLNQKCHDLTETIETILQLPGAQISRSRVSNTTLPELQLRVQNMIRYKLEPLIIKTLAIGQSKTNNIFGSFINEKIYGLQDERTMLQAKSEVYAQSLYLYTRNLSASASQNLFAPQKGGSESPERDTTSITQMGEGYIDAIVELIRKGEDKELRQDLVSKNIEYGEKIAEIDKQLAYYRRLAQIQDLEKNSTSAENIEKFSGYFNQELDSIVMGMQNIIREIDDIYHRLSEDNLNPKSGLYATTLEPFVTIKRYLSTRKTVLLFAGLFAGCMMLTIIIVLIREGLHRTGNRMQ